MKMIIMLIILSLFFNGFVHAEFTYKDFDPSDINERAKYYEALKKYYKEHPEEAKLGITSFDFDEDKEAYRVFNDDVKKVVESEEERNKKYIEICNK